MFPVAEGFDAERLRTHAELPGLRQALDAWPRRRRSWQRWPSCRARPTARSRVKVDIPVALPDDYAFLPSDVAGHQVIRRTPLECWDELVPRTLRFGHPVNVKGQRLELLNA